MVQLTRHPRYAPDIKWSSKSWTHNTFRLYEYIFGRRFGIKAEMSLLVDSDGNGWYACHSFESVFVLTEQYVREYLSSWKIVPFKVYVPMAQTPSGFPVFASPYIFAIAFDQTRAAAGGASPVTTSVTTSGSDRLLVVGESNNITTDNLTATYAGVSVPTQATVTGTIPNYRHYILALAAPATGANNLVTTSSGGSPSNFVASYTGVKQTGFLDSSGTNTSASATSFSVSTTVVASNCWTVGLLNTNERAVTVTDRTVRVDNGTNQFADSNGTVATGSQSTSGTCTIADPWHGIMISFAPVAEATSGKNFLAFMPQ